VLETLLQKQIHQQTQAFKALLTQGVRTKYMQPADNANSSDRILYSYYFRMR